MSTTADDGLSRAGLDAADLDAADLGAGFDAADPDAVDVERDKNATQRDTRSGFSIYLAAGGGIDLADLNVRLVRAGYARVSPRTFRHYGNLFRAGYDRYISINRFDVARASRPYENSSSNSRYSYRPTDLAVSALVGRASRLVEVAGQAVEIGDAGGFVAVHDPDDVDRLRRLRPQPGSPVTVRFLDTGRVADGRVVEVDLLSRPAVIEVELSRLMSIVEAGEGEALPTVDATLTLEGRDRAGPPLELVNRRLYQLMELLEGVRALANRAGAAQRTPSYAAPPVLARLAVTERATVTVRVAAEVIGLFPSGLARPVLAAAWVMPELRAERCAAPPDPPDVARATRDRPDIEWPPGEDAVSVLDGRTAPAPLDAEMRRLEIVAGEDEAALRSGVLRRLRHAFSGSSLGDDEAARLVDEHILKPLRALGRDGIVAIEIDGGTPGRG